MKYFGYYADSERIGEANCSLSAVNLLGISIRLSVSEVNNIPGSKAR